jgi:shikimate dehydrogenase
MVGEPPLDISLDILPTKALVYDIIYNPLESTLLKLARKRGNMTLNGLNMLIHQAIPAWEQWFNIIPTSSEKLITLMEEGVSRG